MPYFKASLLILLSIGLMLWSCNEYKADPYPQPVIHDSTFFRILRQNQFAYYKGKDTLWQPAANSPHGPFRLRFNRWATLSLDDNGKLAPGNTFRDSSIVVKELFDAGGTLTGYAGMIRLQTDSNATAGWVWGEYRLDGSVIESVQTKGSGCVSCHSQTPNRDLVRSFDLH